MTGRGIRSVGAGAAIFNRVGKETCEQGCERGEGVSEEDIRGRCPGPELGAWATAKRPAWLARSESRGGADEVGR